MASPEDPTKHKLSEQELDSLFEVILGPHDDEETLKKFLIVDDEEMYVLITDDLNIYLSAYDHEDIIKDNGIHGVSLLGGYVMINPVQNAIRFRVGGTYGGTSFVELFRENPKLAWSDDRESASNYDAKFRLLIDRKINKFFGFK